MHLKICSQGCQLQPVLQVDTQHRVQHAQNVSHAQWAHVFTVNQAHCTDMPGPTAGQRFGNNNLCIIWQNVNQVSPRDA